MTHAEADGEAAEAEAEGDGGPESQPATTGSRKVRRRAAAVGGSQPVSAPPVAQTVRRARPKVGRNDPCWCGSGKKYKHCHGGVHPTP
jgi:preprotein translocase subunit SecA